MPDARECREIVLNLEAAMPQDDRELRFEKALSRHLRVGCPDAETLAAYYESELTPEEMLACKKHMALCSACREVIAQLAASEHVSFQGEPIGVTEAPFIKEDEARLPVHTRGAVSARAREMPRRMVRWRWAAPAGAIAAGLLVWVSLREMNRPAFVPRPPAQVAAPSAANSHADESAKTLKRPAPPEPTEEARLESSAGKTKPQAQMEKSRREFATSKSPSKSSKQTESRVHSGAGERGEAQIASAYAKSAPGRSLTPNNSETLPSTAPAPGGSSQQATIASAAPAASPSPTQPSPKVAQDKNNQATVAIAGGMAAAPAPNEAGTSNLKKNALVRAADMIPWQLVASPGAKSLWHVGANGTILYSADKGGRWQSQSSGVTVPLSAGSAPSDKICWIVGQNGTILRTVDSGAHWEMISSPTSSDLSGVQASDALHAKIRDTAGRHRYETSDGGATWKEFPAK